MAAFASRGLYWVHTVPHSVHWSCPNLFYLIYVTQASFDFFSEVSFIYKETSLFPLEYERYL